MFYQQGPQGRLGTAGQPGGLRVPQRLPPDGAQVSHRGDRGAGHHRAGEGEAEPGYGGAARGGVGGPEPQHARPD